MKQSRKIFIFTYHTCFWLFRCAWSVRRLTSTDASAVRRLSALLELGPILSTLWTGSPTLWTGWTIMPPMNSIIFSEKRVDVGNYQEHISAWERQAWLRQAEGLFSARGQWLDQFWGEDHQHQVSALVNIQFSFLNRELQASWGSGRPFDVPDIMCRHGPLHWLHLRKGYFWCWRCSCCPFYCCCCSQGEWSCSKAERAFTKKFGLGRKF